MSERDFSRKSFGKIVRLYKRASKMFGHADGDISKLFLQYKDNYRYLVIYIKRSLADLGKTGWIPFNANRRVIIKFRSLSELDAKLTIAGF